MNIGLGKGDGESGSLEGGLGLGVKIVLDRAEISRFAVDKHLEVDAGIGQFAQTDKRGRVLEDPILIIDQFLEDVPGFILIVIVADTDGKDRAAVFSPGVVDDLAPQTLELGR